MSLNPLFDRASISGEIISIWAGMYLNIKIARIMQIEKQILLNKIQELGGEIPAQVMPIQAPPQTQDNQENLEKPKTEKKQKKKPAKKKSKKSKKRR